MCCGDDVIEGLIRIMAVEAEPTGPTQKVASVETAR